MATFTAPQDTERRRAELDARVRGAWADYREALRDLDSKEYANIESASWDQLQATLRELAAQRADLPAAR